MVDREHDVIVVGAGHAGIEAALAAARIGASTLLVTFDLDTIGKMSCNPAIGGLAKGQMVREIDALGGEMGKAIDRAGIQFRMLGTGKGPAVRAPRAQADRRQYTAVMKRAVEEQTELELRQEMAEGLIVAGGAVRGISCKSGLEYRARTVVLTTGTFLKGTVHMGPVRYAAGRSGEPAAERLSDSLADLGFTLGRLKTGTPPRLNGRSIRFEGLELQPGDPDPQPFSFSTGAIVREQVPCHLTYTTERTHRIIRDNLGSSAMYSGAIGGVGPRYCPSIEDKVVRFADRTRHQVFLEPEGVDTLEYYCNGVSTSLPPAVQLEMIASIPGLERAQVIRFAYAIEYDYALPTQLYPWLETRPVANLFFAGQINGTTGYEEAAAQGVLAGINAARRAAGLNPIVLGRETSYIGVLVDDLVTRGTAEPYRMFTSRAEYRLLLRHDNADRRLTPIGREVGLVSHAAQERVLAKEAEIARATAILRARRRAGKTLWELLKRPEATVESLAEPELSFLSREAAEQVEIEARYEGYMARHDAQRRRAERLENARLPLDLDYGSLVGLKKEAAEKLSRLRPVSLGQAARISGISPADVQVLMVHLERRRRSRKVEGEGREEKEEEEECTTETQRPGEPSEVVRK